MPGKPSYYLYSYVLSALHQLKPVPDFSALSRLCSQSDNSLTSAAHTTLYEQQAAL